MHFSQRCAVATSRVLSPYSILKWLFESIQLRQEEVRLGKSAARRTGHAEPLLLHEAWAVIMSSLPWSMAQSDWYLRRMESCSGLFDLRSRRTRSRRSKSSPTRLVCEVSS